MTQDLIARLREEHANWRTGDCVLEAANLLEQQARALEVAREALRPFAKAKAGNVSPVTDETPAYAVSGLKIGDFRRAITALQEMEKMG